MPVVVPLLALDILVVALWCIALALAAAIIMDKLSTILAGVPWVGGKLSDAVKSMAQALTNAAGSLEHGIDSIVGAAWHALSRYIDKLFNQFVTHAAIIAHIAEIVGSHIYSISGLKSFVKSVAYAAHAALKLADKLEKEYHGIEHRVRTIEHELAAGIGNDVRTSVDELVKWEKAARAQIKSLEGEVGQAVPVDLADAERFLGIKPGIRWLDWAAGIVTAALGLEVWNLLKCGVLRNLWNSRGCGLWSALEDLLGLFADAIIFADLCQIGAWVNEIFGPIEGLIVGLISDAANAACAKPPASFATFAVEPGTLPPAQSTGTLPS